MATYVIGDVHGNHDPLCRLLEKIKFDQCNDRLLFVGDLVNRGPKSLETLRFIISLGDSAVSVLGNHDFHLLALHYGVRKRKAKDNSLSQILDANDVNELINGLQSQPLIHIEEKTILVHAGIHPAWNIDTLLSLKNELESSVAAISEKAALLSLYGDTSGNWTNAENSPDRLKYALNVLTRMRYCEADASPEYLCSDSPGNQPEHLTPWFEIHNPHLTDYTIFFGHWAALGYHQHKNIYALDSGCVWGNALSALRLKDKKLFQVSCK